VRGATACACLSTNDFDCTNGRDVGGRDHPLDGIEVFVGEPRAVDINVESKEGAGGVPDLGFVAPRQRSK
jgi:hypothetical protein